MQSDGLVDMHASSWKPLSLLTITVELKHPLKRLGVLGSLFLLCHISRIKKIP